MTKPTGPAALEKVEALYTGNVAEKGPGPNSVGWRDEESQRLRFGKLAAIVDSTTDPLSYNDLGCGYAAMFPFLRDEMPAPLETYRGYDISRDMLSAARQFAADDRVQLVEAPALDRSADYSFVSGTFNVRFDAGDEEWLQYILKTIGNLAGHSRRGFAFNLLTSYVDWREPHLFYGDPSFFVDHCVRNISRRVVLLHDYPLYEWTIGVRL